ncbi:thiazole synthase ThiG [Gottschalkia acidurici 9a]|uniref:Thiazole synthase n=1 Tax=Gottschalkia acidurici (strain ATCC 7906 / DSM 604 / BCRC 14475 / CIP 104303 / KCTC 5404 / NCIMB 10678 / 9a) TaxID=1128398 RepID=K0AZN5_GOTA9|nr:thiazole synthase [Gottschalkia acidurici]AFS78180.1 thiazole synthase ThiG [Gottschalkia acidurici 9a]
MSDKLIIGGKEFSSRLLVGTGKYSSDKLIPQVLEKSKSEIITVALRRVNFSSDSENILSYIPKGIQLLPNTSGARNAEEAIRIARLARATGCGDWIKIEVISDNKYLLPDGYETIKATEVLASEGFVVLPYISPDLMVAKELVNVGAATVMPLGSPIGSNRGIQTRELIRILIDEIPIPVIVDAGIGKPSDACEAMEMGADACLLNTAIASSNDPILMAQAFGSAVEAGRKAYLAGLGEVNITASASSPLTGFLNE